MDDEDAAKELVEFCNQCDYSLRQSVRNKDIGEDANRPST